MAKIKTSELAGQALVWAMALATDTPANAILVDGEPQVWSPDDVSGNPTVGLNGKPRFLLHGTTPCGLFGNPIEFGWGDVGQLIEQEGICLRAIRKDGHSMHGTWLAAYDDGNTGTMVQWVKRTDWPKHYSAGPTAAVAAMRCYLDRKLGAEVEVPEVLLP